MDIVRKYLLPVYQAPEPPAAIAVDPAPPPAADPAAAALAVDPAGAPDPAPAADPVVEPAPAAPVEHGNKGKQPWFLGRISEETSAKNAALERAAAAEQRARDAEALAARLQGGNPDPAAPPLPRQPVTPAPGAPDFQTAVQQEAARQRLYDDSLAIKSAGITKFGTDFKNTLSVLNAVGATTDDFVSTVIAVDKPNAHALLHSLAQDPERAASLASMNRDARIVELTRMSTMAAAPATAPTPAAPAARAVSRAPAPPPPVTPSASKVVDGYSDDATDEQFTQQFNERMKQRAGRR